MASGRVQLAVTGSQDEYITGQPQITFFLKQFKRHTKFAIETLDNPFDGTGDFGNTINSVIPRKGDIIRNMFLRIELSPLTAVGLEDPGYTASIGHAVIEWADLIIGGQTIERITGEYMEMFSEFSVSNSQQDAYYRMTGKTYQRDGLGSATTSAGTAPFGGYPLSFMVPLPFYFYRNSNLGIPLYAITRQEVEVRIKFRELGEVIVLPGTTGVPSAGTTGRMNQVSLLTEYAYLTQEEKDFISARPINYVVEQLQVSRVRLDEGVNNGTFRLNFINPVKELYFVVQPGVYTQRNDWFNYDNPSNRMSDHIQDIELDFNDNTMISKDVASGLYLRRIQPLQHHVRSPTRVLYNYSFALEPDNPEPTGQVNMSRIINKVLKMNLFEYNQVGDHRDVRVYAKSYNVLRVQDGLAGLLYIDNTFM